MKLSSLLEGVGDGFLEGRDLLLEGVETISDLSKIVTNRTIVRLDCHCEAFDRHLDAVDCVEKGAVVVTGRGGEGDDFLQWKLRGGGGRRGGRERRSQHCANLFGQRRPKFLCHGLEFLLCHDQRIAKERGCVKSDTPPMEEVRRGGLFCRRPLEVGSQTRKENLVGVGGTAKPIKEIDRPLDRRFPLLGVEVVIPDHLGV